MVRIPQDLGPLSAPGACATTTYASPVQCASVNCGPGAPRLTAHRPAFSRPRVSVIAASSALSSREKASRVSIRASSARSRTSSLAASGSAERGPICRTMTSPPYSADTDAGLPDDPQSRRHRHRRMAVVGAVTTVRSVSTSLHLPSRSVSGVTRDHGHWSFADGYFAPARCRIQPSAEPHGLRAWSGPARRHRR
jgi:hypothetical protein